MSKKASIIYLAGPDVFKPNAKEIGNYLKYIIESEFNMIGVFPLDDCNSLNSREIFASNKQKIDNCDAVLANLDRFRGPSADVGTVWECGYAIGLGKPVVGYYNTKNCDEIISYKDAVIGKCAHDGMEVEDFGLSDNLMVICGLSCIPQHGVRKALRELSICLHGE